QVGGYQNHHWPGEKLHERLPMRAQEVRSERRGQENLQMTGAARFDEEPSSSRAEQGVGNGGGHGVDDPKSGGRKAPAAVQASVGDDEVNQDDGDRRPKQLTKAGLMPNEPIDRVAVGFQSIAGVPAARIIKQQRPKLGEASGRCIHPIAAETDCGAEKKPKGQQAYYAKRDPIEFGSLLVFVITGEYNRPRAPQ